jgi:hypothetical protein
VTVVADFGGLVPTIQGHRGVETGDPTAPFAVLPITATPQLTAGEVQTLLERAAALYCRTGRIASVGTT